MSGKVVLPKEVAEAIEVLQRAFNYGLYELIDVAHSPKDYEDKDEVYYITTIDTYSQGKYDDVISAIVNGYEVEKTPEELLRKYYESGDTSYHEAMGIRQTLKILGIKIEGVNE